MQLKDYYSILGLGSLESNQDAIKKAYKKAIEEYHPNLYNGDDIKEKLTDVNEAFLILSDTASKRLYDDAISDSNIEDKTNLEKIIAQSNSKATAFVVSYFNGTQKKKRTGCSAGTIVCVIFLFAVFGLIIKNCARAVYDNTPEQVTATNAAPFLVPSTWNKYTIDNSFTLSIPPSLELRSESDTYTQNINDQRKYSDNAVSVFQQKDLKNMSEDAFNTYCRVIAMRAYVGADEVEHYYESPKFQSEDYAQLREIADAELDVWTYVSTPTYKWININGTKGIDISYSRNGVEGIVVCHIYLFFNYDELAKIVTAYRKVDEDKWEQDIENIIKTFEWNILK